MFPLQSLAHCVVLFFFLLQKHYSLAVVIHLVVEQDRREQSCVPYVVVVVSKLRSVACDSGCTSKFIVDVPCRQKSASERAVSKLSTLVLDL